jgi:hypothetical protein
MLEALPDSIFLEAVRLEVLSRTKQEDAAASLMIIDQPSLTLFFINQERVQACDHDCAACEEKNLLSCTPLLLTKHGTQWLLCSVREKKGSLLFSMHAGVDTLPGSSIIRTFGFQFALALSQYYNFLENQDVLPSWFFGEFTNTFEYNA